jgi:hypothetical protein
VVRARLLRHVERRAAGALTGGGERAHLGVRAPRALVPALADDLAVTHDHGADDRVRIRRPAAALREL